MGLNKLLRLPGRIRDDLRIIALVRNWSDVLKAKVNQSPIGVIEMRNGVRLESPPQINLNFLFHEIWIGEFYAPAGYEIRPGETVVDIGANIGVFATWAATKEPNVSVLSFEPFPSNAEIFRKNVEASGLTNIEFHEAAVASGRAKRTLRVKDSWILHSLVSEGDPQEKGITVDCVGLDEALADVDRCDFLKLDCEGGEYEILYSASPATIAKIRRIVCEFNMVDDAKGNGEGLREFFLTNGFIVDDVHRIDHTSGFICARRK